MKQKYYSDRKGDSVWLRANDGSMVCIAAVCGYLFEIGRIIPNPTFPGFWIPLEGHVDVKDIMLHKIQSS